MRIKAILACDKSGGVAKNGTLPWPKNKEDFKVFREYTLNKTVVMGSKTWDDPAFPSPLPNRKNVVITTQPNKYKYCKCICVSGTPKQIIDELSLETKDEIIIIGGANVFKQFMPHIDQISLSLFNDNFDCDTFIPHADLFYKFWVTDKKLYDMFTHILMTRM